MRIILFAGYHDNPAHRQDLLLRLKDLHLKGEMPKFIAVEANRALFQSVVKFQRDAFYRKAKKDDILRDIHPKYLEELSYAISYEADTHSEVFYNVNNIIWLDDVRSDFSTCNDPCGMADRYLETCRRAILELKFKIKPSLRKSELFKTVGNYITSIEESEKAAHGVHEIINDI